MTADAAPNMPQLLSEAKRWFDDALLAGMTAAGEQPVTAAQAAVFATLDPDGTSISELARRMGVTRQTTHQAVHSLIGLGLLEQTPDPSSARSRIVRTTPEGARAHERAQIMLARIEAVLAERVGPQAGLLRDILTRSWGEPPLLSASP
ncbi:MarR family winged helix-turn-helix transcriptional regulator [Streptomyces sp. NPDC088746]|uniref:MarR family winged helix-turn-helix transcriptional regulator n=1 Tax=Streptomyces sp. NPDC088746 TaxID=3365885 RepID=UPI00381CC295